MLTVGLIGGMSWESSALYYRWINEGIRGSLGGLHSAEIVLYSVDFAAIERLQHEGRWEEAAERLAEAAKKVERGGADFIVLCANTMHKVADSIENAVNIPLLHIADATAEEIKARGVSKVGLLATAFTMEQGFYKGRLADEHGLEVLVPEEEDRRLVHGVIYDELCRGEVRESSRRGYRRVMSRLVERGAEAIILGCTEITMLVDGEDAVVPLLDTTAIHARRAVEVALGGDAARTRAGIRLRADHERAILRPHMKDSF